YQGQPVELVLSIALDIVAPIPDPAEVNEDKATDVQTPTSPANQNEPATGNDAISDQAENTPTIDTANDTENNELAPIRIRGTVLEAGQRTPVSGAEVLAVPAPEGLATGRIKKQRYGEDTNFPWSVSATTDEKGNFELRGVPDGRVRLVVITPGYDRIDYIV